jgi:hypothetical protein
VRSQEDPSLELEWLREITPATRLAAGAGDRHPGATGGAS